VQVQEGYHSITVDDHIWDDCFYTYSYLCYFTDGLANGDYRPVYSNTYVTAYYLPYMK
jgi:hypothetical protein